MPFPDSVKTAVLLRCKRYCCKCHKACGVNIEAAHIVAEAEGGPNTEENCIPLCFDCHAEIGHYNRDHPKGNKYRPAELRVLRDETYAWVAAGKTETAAGEASSTVAEEPVPAPISEMEIRALTVVWKGGKRVAAIQVAHEMGISVDRAMVYLHELDRTHGLINWFGNMHTGGESYNLNPKGRRLLFDRGIIE